MVVERVGFHSDFGRFRQSGLWKTPLRLAIINEFRSTQPTTPERIVPTGIMGRYQVTLHIAQDLLSPSLSAQLILWSAGLWTCRILLTFRSSGSRKRTPTRTCYLRMNYSDRDNGALSNSTI